MWGEEAVFLAQKQPPSWSEKFPSFVAVLRWDPKRSSVVKPYTSNVHPKEPGRQGKIKDEKNCHGGKFDLKKTRNLCHLFLLIHLKATKKIYICAYMVYNISYKTLKWGYCFYSPTHQTVRWPSQAFIPTKRPIRVKHVWFKKASNSTKSLQWKLKTKKENKKNIKVVSVTHVGGFGGLFIRINKHLIKKGWPSMGKENLQVKAFVVGEKKIATLSLSRITMICVRNAPSWLLTTIVVDNAFLE